MSDVEADKQQPLSNGEESMDSARSSTQQMDVSEGVDNYEENASKELETNGDGGEEEEEPVIDFRSSMTYWKQVYAEKNAGSVDENSSPVSPQNDGPKSPPPAVKPKPKKEVPQTTNGQSEIDLSSIPGIQQISEDTPVWKRALIEKKNKEAIEKYQQELAAKKAEEDKWAGIPSWKKGLMREQEKKRQVEQAPKMQADTEKEKEEARIQSLPAWKRDLLKIK